MTKVRKIGLYVLILIILSCPCITNLLIVKSEVVANTVTISSDGNVVPSSAPIEHNGNVYTLTSNISGSIAVHRSNIVIDGAGYSLNGNGGTGVDLTNNLTEVPSPQAIWNVTIKNLAILSFHFGINTLGGGNDALYDDYVVTSMSGNAGAVSFWSCGGNNVSYCSIIGESAIDMQFGSSRNTITDNNFVGSVWVEIGGDETVDRNYWSDYFTRYPNATEIDSTGIGNTPYVFYSYVNNASGLTSSPLYDYHPQIKPLSLSFFPSGASFASTNQQASIAEFPLAIIALAVVLITSTLVAFVYKIGRPKS